jgi:hypothetical protein
MRSQAVDGILQVLADRYRRSVVRYLAEESDGVTSAGEIADHLASEGEMPHEDALINLDHVILPTLSDRGIVEYDADTEEVRYQSHTLVEELLDSLDRE